MLCGIEIHQRLSGPKLFCACPSPTPDALLPSPCPHVYRRMKAGRGELGVTDAAVAFEAGRERLFDYHASPPHSCLVELDEEPPSAMSASHLDSALRLALAADASIVDEVQVMRKTVVDGSNTSGFQRTSLVALGGALPGPSGPIPLQTICIEEESAGILPAPKPEERPPALAAAPITPYRLDRLGIPLIEIATEPVFTTPAQAQAAAEAIGMAVRMLPDCMRGLGTIRQDVNVSIPGGARVEVKGLQDLSLMATLIENEVKRQEGLLALYAEMGKREAEAAAPPAAPGTPLDVSILLKDSASKIIRRALDSKGVVMAARLPLMAGLLGRPLYEGRRFGTELSDYAKAAGGVAGLIHSDEDLAKYPFSPSEMAALKEALHIGPTDAFILIADAPSKAVPAMQAALTRAQLRIVPGETRRADDKGGSAFMRPLSGAHRMYPETDIPPIRITPARLESLGAKPLEDVEARRRRLAGLLGADLGEQMLRSKSFPLFERLIGEGLEPKLTAFALEQTMVALRREGVAVDAISADALSSSLRLVQEGRLTKAALPELLKALAASPASSPSALADANGWRRLSADELAKKWIVDGGDVKAFMAKYRLVADGADLAAFIKKK